MLNPERVTWEELQAGMIRFNRLVRKEFIDGSVWWINNMGTIPRERELPYGFNSKRYYRDAMLRAKELKNAES